MPRPDGKDPLAPGFRDPPTSLPLDRASDAAADQDLTVLRLSTQPCGEVAYRADRGVAGAIGRADLAQVA